MKYSVVACAAVMLAGAHTRADWFRDFNNGTLQRLTPVDFAGGYNISVVNGSLRFESTGSGGTDDSAIGVDFESFTDVSALLLIRYSTNPNLGPPGTKMNGGLLIHANLNTVSGYVLVMNDSGYLQLRKVIGGAVCYAPACVESLLQDEPDFTHTKDWWIRFEAQNEGSGVHLSGRAWPDGTMEPCEWHVETFDTSNPFLSGIVALVANKDENGYFIDLDNASASSSLSCQEVCDNGVDDNQDGLVDCRDPQCNNAAACACHAPFADADGDGDVDMDDFGVFQRCYTGSGGHIASTACGCFDRDDINQDGHFSRLIDGDGDVDADDLAAFTGCFTGPGIPANPACGG